MHECVFYLAVSQVSLQMGDFLPQLLQLLLARLSLVSFFFFLLLSLVLQPLDDSLLDIKKRGRGMGVIKGKRTEQVKSDRRGEREVVKAPTVIHSLSSFFTNNSRIKLYVLGSSDRI